MLTAIPCSCGQYNTDKDVWTKNGINIVKCSVCGVRRVHSVDKDAYTAQYTSGHYHNIGSDDLPHQAAGREPHKTRLEIDMQVARIRMSRLLRYKNPQDKYVQMDLVDVGCANGAFMMQARTHGFTVHGVDLAKDAADISVRDRVHVGDLRSVGFQRRFADVITFNDCLEHFIDPVSALKAAKGILKRDGVLVVDIPDMSCKDALEKGQDFHHVKPHEHIFYWTANQIRDLLETNGFTIVGMEVPVPGKVTVYASPESAVETITILGPPGVGDTLWTLQKLAHIQEVESPCRIRFVVQSKGDLKAMSRAKDFLLCCPYIDEFGTQEGPLPRDVGCADPSYPIYELFPNDYLEPTARFVAEKASGTLTPISTGSVAVGGMIENWLPQLPDNWEPPFGIPACAKEQVRMRLDEKKTYVAVYLSSRVWNNVVAEPDWTAKDWAELLIKIRNTGIIPIILGGGSDADFAQDVAQIILQHGIPRVTDVWINLVNRTSLPLAMAYMEHAAVTIGIANGLPMLPLYTGGKSIIFWPTRDDRDVRRTAWTPEFSVGWVPPHIRNSGRYKALHLGKFTVDSFLADIIEMVGIYGT